MEKPTILECRSVWKIYGSNAEGYLSSNPAPQKRDLLEKGLIGAVCAANVRIRKGEIFVIMGLSGSGKSTLVRCLSRLVEPTAGEVFFEGKKPSRNDRIRADPSQADKDGHGVPTFRFVASSYCS